VLSIGHASTLLYSLLHLSGVRAVSKDYETLGELSVTLDALKTFRQLNSRCPGHPEYRSTSGVETTTGPLGQGVAPSVGMAAARQWLSARYHRPGFEDLFDFDVYALCGDGCMMEGISSEAASLAGHWRLSTSVGFMTITTSRLRAIPTLRSPRTLRHAFSLTGGMSGALAMQTNLRLWLAHSELFKTPKIAPR
jgi:transketolase